MYRFIRFATIVFVALYSLQTVCTAAKQTPLNLVIIQTDEHHFGTLGCYGGDIVGTPNIDWIGESGAVCTSFYATTPVCSPSRGSLVSGLYPQKTPVTTNNIPLDDSIITFAEILKRKGYATGYAGKWHLDGSGKPQWAPKRKFGFEDNRFMFNRGHWKKFIDTEKGPAVGARDKQGRPTYGLDGADEKTFATDWLCDKVVDFVNDHADKPFCYMVSLPDPHGPNSVRAPYDTMFDDVRVPIPVTLVRKPAQIPAWGKPAGVKPEQLRKLMQQYYGMVRCIDDNVGKIIKALKQQGVLEHTMIVFTSDHGDLCGEHGRLNKGVPYEGSARIPFLVYCPGKIKPGTRIGAALGTVDFMPTALSLLGVKYDGEVDGRDASELLQGESDGWIDMAFVRSTGSPKPRGQDNAWISVISERYKLVYSDVEEPWLLDLKEDPTEVTNQFGNRELRGMIREMTKGLDAYGKAMDDPYTSHARIRSWMNQALAD